MYSQTERVKIPQVHAFQNGKPVRQEIPGDSVIIRTTPAFPAKDSDPSYCFVSLLRNKAAARQGTSSSVRRLAL